MSGNYVYKTDGTLGRADYLDSGDGVLRPILDAGLAVGGSVTPPPPPPPSGQPRIGAYSSAGAGNDSDWINVIGHAPEVANDYYQTATVGSLASQQTPRINRGTAPLLALSLKQYFVSRGDDNHGLASLANGPSDPDYSAMVGFVTTFANQLKTLCAVDPSVPVYAALEGEPDAKVNKYMNVTPRPSGDQVLAVDYIPGTTTYDVAQAGRGMNVALRIIRNIATPTNSPNLRLTYWVAGTQKAYIDTIGFQLDADLVDCWVWDPYTNGTQVETMLACFNTDLNWARSNRNYTRWSKPELGIGECGMSNGPDWHNDTTGTYDETKRQHTDAQYATYIYPDRLTSGPYTMRDTLRDAGASFASLFNAPRDQDHVITDGRHPLTVAAMKASMEDS